jgi:hypothetical protein
MSRKGKKTKGTRRRQQQELICEQEGRKKIDDSHRVRREDRGHWTPSQRVMLLASSQLHCTVAVSQSPFLPSAPAPLTVRLTLSFYHHFPVAEQDAARIPGACTRATLTATLLLSALTSSSIIPCVCCLPRSHFPTRLQQLLTLRTRPSKGPWSLLNLGRPSLGTAPAPVICWLIVLFDPDDPGSTISQGRSHC